MRPVGTAQELERRRRHAVELMRRGESPSVVARILGVGTLRNKMSDAHGRGPKPLYKVGKEHADHMIQITSAHITFVVKQAGL